ncbi:MAG: hypothetical protein ACXWKB_06260, partial [Methyloceanibacter sp.]
RCISTSTLTSSRLAPSTALKSNSISWTRRGRSCGAAGLSPRTPVRINGTGHGLVGTALIDNLNGEYQEPNFKLTLVRFWFVLGKSP